MSEGNFFHVLNVLANWSEQLMNIDGFQAILSICPIYYHLGITKHLKLLNTMERVNMKKSK